MKYLRRVLATPVDATLLCLLMAIYFVAFLNWQLNSAVADILSNAKAVKVGFVISLPLFIVSVFNILFNLLCWPRLTRPVFSLLILLSAALSYAAYNYGVVFDKNMILNIFETDSSESASYLSTYSALWMFFFGLLPVGVMWLFSIRHGKNAMCFLLGKLTSVIASLVVLLLILVFYYQDYASLGRNHNYLKRMIVPTYFLNSASKYINQNYISEPLAFQNIGLDAQQSSRAQAMAETKPTLLVYVVGETARAQNYPGAGYERETTPYTAELGMDYIATIDSCGTSTAVSVPCMFSELGREQYSRQRALAQDNLLDVLGHAGIASHWIENNGGDKGVATRITKLTLDRKRVDDVCNGSSCLDIGLLENLEAQISDMNGNRVLVLHLLGSHGPTYFQRYPRNFAHFMPDCPRADIENCTEEALVNTYDNTIRYTDFVLSQLIERLAGLQEAYNPAIIYVSDHGESLGEHGVFLHGLPYSLAPEYQTKVPLMFWASEGFKEEKRLDTSCLSSVGSQQTLSHDNLFHSVLGIMDVSTSLYDEREDLFAGCR